MGHSLGGFLSVLAAARKPELACGLVLLDSPIIGGILGAMVNFAKSTGFGARYSPGHVSQRRRHHWASPEAAHNHFRAKAAFARWDAEVLHDDIADRHRAVRTPDGKGRHASPSTATSRRPSTTPCPTTSPAS